MPLINKLHNQPFVFVPKPQAQNPVKNHPFTPLKSHKIPSKSHLIPLFRPLNILFPAQTIVAKIISPTPFHSPYPIKTTTQMPKSDTLFLHFVHFF